MAWVSSKRKSLMVLGSIVLGSAAMVAPSLLIAQQQPSAPNSSPATAPSAAARPQPAMQAMGRGYRGMRGQVSDASKNESTLQMLADFEMQSLQAKAATPPTITALPEADRPAKLAEYKKEMIKLIRQTLDAEEALLNNDNAKATETITAMGATQMEGHQAFRGRGGGGGGRRGGGDAGGAGQGQ